MNITPIDEKQFVASQVTARGRTIEYFILEQLKTLVADAKHKGKTISINLTDELKAAGLVELDARTFSRLRYQAVMKKVVGSKELIGKAGNTGITLKIV